MLPEIKTILFATNLGPEAKHVFNYALSQAFQYQAKIHVLHVVEPLSGFARSLVEQNLTKEKTRELQEQSKAHLLEEFKSRLESFCQDGACQLDQGWEMIADVKILEGRPPEVIKKQAEALGADLIVMGTHRRGLSSSGLIGSTARKVVNNASVPVLTVFTPDDQLEDID